MKTPHRPHPRRDMADTHGGAGQGLRGSAPIASKGFISLNVEYIDGTKIESKANKYTFVWRRTVERNRERDRINHVVSLFIHIGLERCEEVQSKWQIVQFVEKAIITELK